jgi:hypothetical protein
MLRLLLLFLLAFAPPAWGALPAVTCSINFDGSESALVRAAPLGVHLDCSGTTDSDHVSYASEPFHVLVYRTNWGDSNAGNWLYGTSTSYSKNLSFGPIAGHVYETHGTYTITTVVCDTPTSCAPSVSNTIEVVHPDVAYATTTACISNSPITVGQDGCPPGSTPYASQSDFRTAVVTGLGVNGCGTGVQCKRFLFKRGDTFTYTAVLTLSGYHDIYLGAYGTSSVLPTITKTTTCASAPNRFHAVDFDGANNLKVVGLSFNANDTTKTALCMIFNQTTGVARQTYAQNYMQGAQVPINGGGASGTTNTDVTIYENDCLGYNKSDGYCVALGATRYAVLGNNFDNVGGAHPLRMFTARKAVVSNNTFLRRNDGSDHVKIMAANGFPSYQIVVSDNNHPAATALWTYTIGPQDHLNDERVYDVIVERNYIAGSTGSQVAIQFAADYGSIRNNIFNASGSSTQTAGIVLAHKRGIEVGQGAGNLHTHLYVENNTLYSTRAYEVPTQAGTLHTSASRGFVDGTVIVRNNLARFTDLWYYDVAANCAVAEPNQCAMATFSNNTTAAEAQNPSFDNVSNLPIGFRPSVTKTYPATGGTTAAAFAATSVDFYRCSQSDGVRIGALVPRTLARCAGVAGQ